MFRTVIVRQSRAFTTCRPLGKGPVEIGKDALKKVDEVASAAALKGIDAGGKSEAQFPADQRSCRIQTCLIHRNEPLIC